MSPSQPSLSVATGDNLDFAWEQLSPVPSKTDASHAEAIPDRVRRVAADLDELDLYYNLPNAPRRYAKIKEYCSSELSNIKDLPFDSLSQQDKVDIVLLTRFLEHLSRHQTLVEESHRKVQPLVPFESSITALCEARQDGRVMQAEQAAHDLDEIRTSIVQIQTDIQAGRTTASKPTAHQATKVIENLRGHLQEWFDFYSTYDPAFDWWATTPWQAVDTALAGYIDTILFTVVGIDPGNGGHDQIVGEPIGRAMLLSELSHEMIPYTPEELLSIAHKEYDRCLLEMKAISNELGFGSDWKKTLDHVKTQSAPISKQTDLVRHLVNEAAAYVQHHDLVTVPPLAASTWRMFTLTPSQQRTAPFFLGGPSILVASPASSMGQPLKAAVLRANNRHFSRAVALHEMIPGHRLQRFAERRHSTHRAALFSTPFLTEGWATYWELLLWDRGDFFVTPEDRAGTMFWRMHRCMRVVFSLRFHLGELTPRQCVDLLVAKVGHERAAAEAEVRRSLEGSPLEGAYGPLYQAAYLLGALQLRELRRVVLAEGRMGEREFHDAVLRAGGMPVEMIKALLLGEALSPRYQTRWRFYD
ncbi:unnamed protein product [Clonostachys solani]|uniref:X-Pro dipeptidyl-peptidase n=1 Tax=Clonostachys solani TaxID=160281 RepID=A0A9N9ZF27_9HYPO|nr:unnamed protein product [Clonostachys solani]